MSPLKTLAQKSSPTRDGLGQMQVIRDWQSFGVLGMMQDPASSHDELSLLSGRRVNEARKSAFQSSPTTPDDTPDDRGYK